MGAHLSSGQFYGAVERSATGGAFAIRALTATGREDDVETHTHEDAHFILILSGIYISTARGAPKFARAPFLLFNPPGTVHRDRFVEGRGAFAVVSFDACALIGATDFTLLSTSAAPLFQPEAMTRAFRLAREIRGIAPDAEVLEGAAWDLVHIAGRRTAVDRFPPPWAYSAFEVVMDCSSAADFRVRDMAARFDVHPVHLARVFRQAWGCSPGELLRWRRAERAGELLLRSRLSMAEIAAEVGFVDQSHMSRAFRATFGLAPGAWRRARNVSPIQDAEAALRLV